MSSEPTIQERFEILRRATERSMTQALRTAPSMVEAMQHLQNELELLRKDFALSASAVMPETERHRVSKNSYQGNYTKVLCVCSGGILRSPTLAWLLSNPPYNCNARAAGSEHYALIPLDQTLIDWADLVIFLNPENYRVSMTRFKLPAEKVAVFKIPDRYAYRDPELIQLLRKAVDTIPGRSSSGGRSVAW